MGSLCVAPTSCDIHTHTPAQTSSASFLPCAFVTQTRSSSCHGHGRGHECRSPAALCAAGLDSIRGSSVKLGTMQRRSAWPLRKDDTHKSRSVSTLRAGERAFQGPSRRFERAVLPGYQIKSCRYLNRMRYGEVQPNHHVFYLISSLAWLANLLLIIS